MATKTKIDGTTFSWTAPKGMLTAGLFLAIAFVSEFFMVSFFMGSGLTESSASQLPVSPLFHILPLVVIIVLVLSWTYLTKQVAMRPHRKAPAKVSKSRRHPRRARKAKTSAMATIKSILDKIGSAFSSSGSDVSSLQRRSFGGVAVESAITVLTVFLLAAILSAVLVYPQFFTDFAVDFYSSTLGLQGFLQSLAEGLVSLAGGLDSVAPGFRSAFEGLVSPISSSLSGGDLLWRYVFCQNAAAWISALTALVYVRYFLRPHRGSR
jgi:hypothetical protein